MYRKKVSRQLEFVDFYMPFSGELSAENRWVKLAEIIPWELAEEIYADAFREDFGAPALPARVALGALLIKEREGLTDRGTVETIQENPYMQFFIGLHEFTEEPAFDASLMVDFRGSSRIIVARPENGANLHSDTANGGTPIFKRFSEHVSDSETCSSANEITPLPIPHMYLRPNSQATIIREEPLT